MRRILQFMFISIVLLQVSCSKEDDAQVSRSLRGVWVHTDTKADTMDFNARMFSSDKTFELRRGKEIQEGNEVTKAGSGFYLYEIKGDSIYLRNLVSSYGGSTAYYFKIDPDGKSFDIASFVSFTKSSKVNKFKRIDETGR